MRNEKWEVRSEKQEQNNDLQKIIYAYDMPFFFNCKADHMHTKSYKSCHSRENGNPENKGTGCPIKNFGHDRK